MRVSGGLVLLGLLLGSAAPAVAQQATAEFPRWQAATAPPVAALVTDPPRPRTYGLVGFLAGLAVGAVAGGLLGDAMCDRYADEGESCTPGIAAYSAIGAALFGLIGYAIGRGIRRGEPAAEPDAVTP